MTNLVGEFPYTSHYVEVLDSKMHYVSEGSGPVVLFIHGVPTWSYLWRHIIPYVSETHQAIAVDLIGFGKSLKPDIAYDVFDHIRYVSAFIEKLNLKDITLVMHGFGSIVGLAIAMENPELFRSLVLLESHIRASDDCSKVSMPVQELRSRFTSTLGAYQMVTQNNYYVDKVMTAGVLKRLSDEELDNYRMPFPTPESRTPIWQYIQDLPAFSKNDRVSSLIEGYSKKLQASQIPKLLMYAIPGFVTTMDTVAWAKDNLPNCKLEDIGEALHYAQESNPKAIGAALKRWLAGDKY